MATVEKGFISIINGVKFKHTVANICARNLLSANLAINVLLLQATIATLYARNSSQVLNLKFKLLTDGSLTACIAYKIVIIIII